MRGRAKYDDICKHGKEVVLGDINKSTNREDTSGILHEDKTFCGRRSVSKTQCFGCFA